MNNFFLPAAAASVGIIAIMIIFLLAKSLKKSQPQNREENAVLLEKINGYEARALEYKEEIGEKNRKIDDLLSQLTFSGEKTATLETTLAGERTKFEEKLALLNSAFEEKLAFSKSAKEELSNQFTKLSIDIFESRNKAFSIQTSDNVQQLLNPFREQIHNFKKQLDTNREMDLRERTSLKVQIENLSELNRQITEEAGNLTKALKGEVKTQGTWGEVILEKVLEKSGLVKGREFEIQESLKNAEGKRYQPDVVVHLPNKRDIIIDSKVSLLSYDRLAAAETKEERIKFCNELTSSVKSHIKSLSEKDYQKLLGINSLDFILMFIPLEGAFSATAQHDSSIFSYALERNIFIVSPSTLFASLRTIENIWKYEHQNKNAQEIAKRAGMLYDKFVGFVSDLEIVGKGLDSAKKSYDTACSKLSTGRGNLVNMSENLRKLGAPVSKKLPSHITLEDDAVDVENSRS